MKNYIHAKYYTYIPGEFMPIYDGNELLNSRAFHQYKLRRAVWRATHPSLTYQHLTHSNG